MPELPEVEHLRRLKRKASSGQLRPARAQIALPPRVEEIALPDERALPDGEAAATKEMSEQAVAELMGAETEKDDEPRVPTSYIAEPDSD